MQKTPKLDLVVPSSRVPIEVLSRHCYPTLYCKYLERTLTRLEHTDVWPSIEAELSTTSIFELAANYGVTASQISGAVRRTGIGDNVRKVARPVKPQKAAPVKAKKGRTSKIAPFRDLLGTVPDAVIAQKAGATVATVCRYRAQLGIAAYSKRNQTPEPPKTEKKKARRGRKPGNLPSVVAAYEADLGVLTDAAIALKANVTPGAVRSYRARLGIPSATENKRTARDTSKKRRKSSKIDPYRKLVGRQPDKTIAKKAGVTISAVGEYRRRHGIPAYSTTKAKAAPKAPPAPPKKAVAVVPASPPEAKKPRKRRKARSKIDPYTADLGVLLDREIAEKAGVTPEAVRLYRTRQGIPSVTQNRRNAAAKAKSETKPIPTPREAVSTAIEEEELPPEAGSTEADIQLEAEVVETVEVQVEAPEPVVETAEVETAGPKTAEVEVETAEVVPVEVEAEPRTSFVWSVRYGDDESCFVRGVDLASAGGVLRRASIEDVRSVKRLGELL